MTIAIVSVIVHFSMVSVHFLWLTTSSVVVQLQLTEQLQYSPYMQLAYMMISRLLMIDPFFAKKNQFLKFTEFYCKCFTNCNQWSMLFI